MQEIVKKYYCTTVKVLNCHKMAKRHIKYSEYVRVDQALVNNTEVSKKKGKILII